MSWLWFPERGHRRDNEPTGAPESLVGRVNVKDMGSRAGREAPKDLEKKRKTAQPGHDSVDRGSRRKAPQVTSATSQYNDILAATEDLEGLTYRPKTSETREVYELLLGQVHQSLGDQAQDVIRSATDTVLEILKSEDLKEFDKKKEIEAILSPISNDHWSQFVNLARKITDYTADQPDAEGEDGEGGRKVEGEEGVAVLFEDEDGDDDEQDDFEIRDEESDDEEEEGAENQEHPDADQDMEEDSGLVLGNRASKKEDKSKKDIVAPHEIDGFWLQRLVSSAYPDPIEANDLTSKTLEMLSSELDLRDLENSLAELFGYSNFDLVATLTKNRDAIVWCTKLSRSSEDERHDIEVAMREKGVGWILRDLAGDRSQSKVNGSTDTVKRGNNQTSAQVDVKGTTAPRQIVDIDSMIFSQGGHLMSNKKVKLPQGSFKRSGKGFEEIHVPTPEKRPASSNITPVQIAGLPSWTHPVWGKTRELNPVQSKVFPIAFNTDEPMLLCAPTGAGKTNCAMLTMLRTISRFRDEDTGVIDLDSFKIIYVAPMKALVQEQVQQFSARLAPLGIRVAELTGDSQMTKQQIAETQVIVTTPEKWDVITRKTLIQATPTSSSS